MTVAVASAGFRPLNGRWRRPDGGYIIEIQAVDPGGPIDAAYFNPRPINVARADARREGSTLQLFPSGASYPATLLVYPNGTYATEAGAFTAKGKAQLKNGRLDFITSYTSGGLAVDNRTGSASPVDKGTPWGLVGSGWADAGLYNFDFSKPK